MLFSWLRLEKGTLNARMFGMGVRHRQYLGGGLGSESRNTVQAAATDSGKAETTWDMSWACGLLGQ